MGHLIEPPGGRPGGLLRFRGFQPNSAWLELGVLAQDLLAWTQQRLLEGELARCECKWLRYRSSESARASPASPAGCAWGLGLRRGWAWGEALLQAFARLGALPQPP